MAGLSADERDRERRRIEMLLKPIEDSPEDEAAAFLAEVERLGGIAVATKILSKAKPATGHPRRKPRPEASA